MLRPAKTTNIPDIKLKKDDPSLELSNCDIKNATSNGDLLSFSTPHDKLNIIGVHFERINSPRYLNIGTETKETVDATAETIRWEVHEFRANNCSITIFDDENPSTNPGNTQASGDNLFYAPAEVTNVLKKLPNKVSSGLDDIPPIVLKHLPASIINSYTILFNNALNRYYFPTSWKRAKVLPVYKKGKNPNDPVSYRPISLTPIISKVFEIILNKRIVKACTDNEVIPDNQFGFRHQHSTTHAINKLMSDVSHHLKFIQHTAALLIDLEKAFDSGWTNGLLYKCINYKFNKWLICMILAMISGKSFVTWDGINISSPVFQILEGFQQGTVNSPILLNILTASIVNSPSMNQTTEMIPYTLRSIAFADDSIIYLSGPSVSTLQNELQTAADDLTHHYALWNLRVNPAECEVILFRRTLVHLASSKKEAWKTSKSQWLNQTPIPQL